MAKKKATPIASAEYILLLAGFTEWLQLLGYSPFSVVPLAGSISHFLQYQEGNGRASLQQLEAIHANEFITLLTTQTGRRTGRPFSNGHINKQVQALNLLSKYLRETGRNDTGFSLARLPDTRAKPTWLTKAEIAAIYGAIKDNLLGIRDKAMLAVFYGCGLRLNEGASLELNDINQITQILHVKKGKHYKERFVPVAEKNFEEIKLYMDYARPQLLQQTKTEALFIGANKGVKMDKQSLYVRIKLLVKKSGIKKRTGTHTLRHSIATHLLQSGMKLEKIQQFLGHADLDSTQIYTHLQNESP